MSTYVSATITACLNVGLLSGNRLVTSSTDLTPVQQIEFVQNDDVLLNLYFAQSPPVAGFSGAPVNMQLADGVGLAVSGIPADDFSGAALFLATNFTQQIDTNGLYFYQAVLNLNTPAIAAALAALGDNVPSLDILISIAFQGIGVRMRTIQIDGTLLRSPYPSDGSGIIPTLAAAWAAYAAIVAQYGGALQLKSQTTGTIFPVVIDGSDAAPSLSILPASTAVAGAIALPGGYVGPAYLHSRVTGSSFGVCIDGSDAAPALEILPAGTAPPAGGLQIGASGAVTMPNRASGTFFTVALAGPDSAPYIVILPAAS